MREELDRRFCGRCGESCGGFEEHVPTIDPPRRCVDCAIEVRNPGRWRWRAFHATLTAVALVCVLPPVLILFGGTPSANALAFLALGVPLATFVYLRLLTSIGGPRLMPIDTALVPYFVLTALVCPPSRVAADMGLHSYGDVVDWMAFLSAILIVCGAGRAARKRVEREREFVDEARKRDLLPPADLTKKSSCRRCSNSQVPEGATVCPRCSAILFESPGYIPRNIVPVHVPTEEKGA